MTTAEMVSAIFPKSEHSALIGDYTFKSPYHKNKRLPFRVFSISNGQATCETVEYRGWTKNIVNGKWPLEEIYRLINTGYLRKNKEATA